MSPEEIIAQEETAESAVQTADVISNFSEEAGGDVGPAYDFKYDPDMAGLPNRTADEIIFDEMEKTAKIAMMDIPHGTPHEKIRTAAMYRLGKYMSVVFTGRFLLGDGIMSMAQVRRAEDYLGKILEDPTRTCDEKLSAIRILADVEAGRAKLGEHLMGLAEKSKDNTQNGKRRNLPPVAGATMVNVPGQNATVVFQNANAGIEPTPARNLPPE